MTLPAPADINLYTAAKTVTNKYEKLPENLAQAKAAARESDFVKAVLPERIVAAYI